MFRSTATNSVRPKYQLCLLIAASLAAAPLTASHAASASGWYAAANVGVSDLQKPDQTIANAPTPGATLAVVNDVDAGWTGALAIGRAMGPVRLEAEIGRSENKSKAYSAISPISITLPQDGHTDATRYMANAYYDFPLGPLGAYVGAGLGAADVTVTTFAAPARAPTAPPSQLLNYSQAVFAYQLMAGLSHPLGQRLTLTGQYRWFDAGTVKGRDARGQRATRDMSGHNFEVGLRYAF